MSNLKSRESHEDTAWAYFEFYTIDNMIKQKRIACGTLVSRQIPGWTDDWIIFSVSSLKRMTTIIKSGNKLKTVI